MTPCEERGYKIGQVFEVIDGFCNSSYASKGDLVVLDNDDGTQNPYYFNLSRPNIGKLAGCIVGTKRIYPPEEPSQSVEVTCEGKTITISRKDAKTLNLCD